MQSKTIFTTTIVAVFLILASFTALSQEPYVRWNYLLDECVYYYQSPEGASHCYVDEELCVVKDGKNQFVDLGADQVRCLDGRVINTDTGTQACAEFIEEDLVVLEYEGSDPDLDIGPAGRLIYTVSEPFTDGNRWQTERGDAGTYNVVVTVSDGEFEDRKTECITVLEKNVAPVLTVSDINVNEGETVKINPNCIDEDGDIVDITYSGDLTTDTWEPTFEDAGRYEVLVKCYEVDNEDMFDEKKININVRDVNRAPNLRVFDVTAREGDLVKLDPSCADPDGLPVEFDFAGDLTSNEWQTGYNDAGVYNVDITCTDASGLSTMKTATVTIENKNRPPSLTIDVRQG